MSIAQPDRSPAAAPAAARLCVGQIATAHGVRGLVKLLSFTADPAAIAGYGPLSDETGRRRFAVTLVSAAKDHWLARIDGITDRTAAEALRGIRLYVDRAALPEPDEDEFYHADLIGLPVEDRGGDRIGTVVSIQDFGAGDLLEIRLAGGAVTAWLPFTRAAVPVVDIRGGRLIAEPPAGWLDPAEPPPAGAMAAAGETADGDAADADAAGGDAGVRP